MNLVRNFQALSSTSQSIRLSWDKPLDDGYNALSDIDILTVGSNSITVSAPLNVEAGYLIHQGSGIYTVTTRGINVSTIQLNNTTGLVPGNALLKIPTLTVVQRRKDAFPVELEGDIPWVQNIAVQIFSGSEVIGSGTATVVNGNNIFTDTNASFTQDLVGRVFRDSGSFNFVIEAVLSATQLQLQSNDTLHNGVYVILSDFSQILDTTLQPIDYTKVTSGPGVITDPNGFLMDPTNKIFAQNHQLMNRIVVDSNGNPYVILDNTSTQLIINNTTATPAVGTFPAYTILPSFNGVNSLIFYIDNFKDKTEASVRAGTGLEPDTWYYYTAFTKDIFIGPAGEIYAPFDNVSSTQSYALSTGDTQFGSLIYNQLWPEVYRLTDPTTDASGNPAASGTGNLQDLMSVFGVEFDELYSLVNTFQLQNPYKIALPVLSQFAYQLNIPPTDSLIGIDTLRRIANEMIDIYRKKGNKISIGKFVRVITTWDITNGTGDFDQAIIDSVPNLDALRFYSSALGSVNTRFYGYRIVVGTFTPNSYDSVTGIVSIPTSVDLSQVQINDYLDIGGTLYAIMSGITNTPVPNGTVLFNNSSSVGFTYNSLSGVIQYASSVSLGSVNPNDIFFDGAGSQFVIISVNAGSNQLTIATGQSVDTAASPGGGGSIQQGQKEVTINTGLMVTIAPSTIVRPTPEVNIVPAFTPNSYDISTGFVSVPDSVALADVMVGDYFIDSSGSYFTILGGIDNQNGQKKFQISTGQTVALGSGALINRISQVGAGRFLKQLPGIIIPGFFTFREFVINVPAIAMFIPIINSITVNNGQATISFQGTPNFGRDNGLAGCLFYPNQSYPKEFFEIVANTATTITLKGVPQFAQTNDISLVLSPLNSARFQRILNLITLVSPYNTLPAFSFELAINAPI